MHVALLLGQSSSESDGISVPLLIAAAVAGVAWLVVLAIVATTRRPPAVPGALATQDLPPESPALAGLLSDDFEIGSEAVPATVLDLAARGVFSLEEIEPGRTICRVARRGAGQLTPYEDRVYDTIRDRAIDGIVPAAALTPGTRDASQKWQREFQKEVIADSHARGLTRDRWPSGLCGVLGLGLVLVGLLVGAAVMVGGEVDPDETRVAIVAGAVTAASLVLISVTVGRFTRSLAQLPTDAGMAAARRCIGLQTQLRDHEQMDAAPPASVVIWGRHLAYAAALGAARASVIALPMGEEDDNHAWSRFGGAWRRVRVRYPRAWPPAWGKSPVAAIFLALFWGVFAGLVVFGLTSLASDLAEPLGPNSTVSQETTDLVGRIALLLCIPFALVIGWALVVLAIAVPGCWRRRHVTGELVRMRSRSQIFSREHGDPWYYLAVDDGTGTRITAWRVRGARYRTRSQGETVTAEISPVLGYVWGIERAEPPKP